MRVGVSIEVGCNLKKDNDMKRVFIIRHAKSSWSDENLSDFDRPLNKRGEANAPAMAKRFKDRGIIPDAIISSSAVRAKATAILLAQNLNFTKEILYKESLYEADTREIEEILRSSNDMEATLFLIGHNPEFNMFAQEYLGFDENIVTCGVVEIEFNCEKWSEISSENAKFISYDYPKKQD